MVFRILFIIFLHFFGSNDKNDRFSGGYAIFRCIFDVRQRYAVAFGNAPCVIPCIRPDNHTAP